jgi:pectate lyase
VRSTTPPTSGIFHIVIAIGFLIAASAQRALAVPAFPGAEGPGATASGGRVGDVYHVTSLLDDHDGTIPGTLRFGLVTAPSAGRTIVFDIGGTIHLVADVHNSTHTWLRTSNSNITIAGQTAPGNGITIVGQGAKFTGSNMILRNVKLRPGQDQTRPGILTNDGLSNYLQNSMVDHVSISWADDEGLSSTDFVNNTTVQYSIIGEGLNYTLDDGSRHAFGALISSQNNDAPISYHHNLFIHLTTRDPRLGSEAGTGAITNFSNNVIYNWSGRAGYSIVGKPSRTDYLGNYYIAGANTGAGDRVFYSPDTNTRIYHNNTNRVDMSKNGVLDGGTFSFSGPQFEGTFQNETQPFAVAGAFLQTAADAVPTVLSYAGADWWNRDPVDTRLINNAQTFSGSIINFVNDAPKDPNYSYDANGFPIYPVVQRPADFDADQDGMADAWEATVGLNPAVPDNAGDFDSDGYTNLEEYLNELGAFPAPKPLAWSGADSRYALSSNWDLQWQPSRFDSVMINAGTATVDAFGQAAGNLTVATGATLNITAGRLDVWGSMTVNGRVTWQAGQLGTTSATNLVIGDGVHPTSVLLGAGRDKLLRVHSLAIGTLARLDLSDNAMIVDSGSISAIAAAITTGYASGTWLGDGVTSSSAPGSILKTALGYATADSIGVTMFHNQPVDGSNILVLYTLAGDANLDGEVSTLDFNALAANFGLTSKLWYQADFDYDGEVNTQDFNLLAANFGQQLAPASPNAGMPGATVPEPSSILLITPLLAGLLSRKTSQRPGVGKIFFALRARDTCAGAALLEH